MRLSARSMVPAFAVLMNTIAAVAAPGAASKARVDVIESALDAAQQRIALVSPGVPPSGHASPAWGYAAFDSARALLTDTASTRIDPLSAVIDTAQRAADDQAQAVDMTNGRETVRSTTVLLPKRPSAAALELVARHGVTLTRAQRDSIGALDGLEEPLRDAVNAVIQEFLHFEDAAMLAYGSEGQAIMAAPRLADLGNVFTTRRSLLDAIIPLRDASRAKSNAAEPVNACPALAIDLAGSDDSYFDDCALIVDVGGDDGYTNNAGGAGDCGALVRPEALRAAALVDLGGADVYADHVGGQCGQNGGASYGAGLLVDAEGDDFYHASGAGANGGGVAGAGLLIDAAGQDFYLAESSGVNGGGDGGIGLLIDAGGDDAYSARSLGVNGGARSGIGRLIDLGGNDVYEGADGGVNGGGAQGGSGLLLDIAGTDFYYATGASAVNGGGDLGAGLLLDASGTGDVYALFFADQTMVPKGTVGAQIDLPVP